MSDEQAFIRPCIKFWIAFAFLTLLSTNQQTIIFDAFTYHNTELTHRPKGFDHNNVDLGTRMPERLYLESKLRYVMENSIFSDR